MRTVKWNPFLSGVYALLGGVLLWSGMARADVTSTNPAAILVFPKLVVDSTDPLRQVDTIIQITNTADTPVNARCFYVNANGHCSNDPTVVCDPESTDPSQCGTTGICRPGWVETDFAFRLTTKQPVVWTVSTGLPTLPLDSPSCQITSMSNVNCGSVPPAPEDPMIGELKCVEVDDSEAPVDRNDLKGEATIESVHVYENEGFEVQMDSRGYNAIGIKAVEGGNNGDDVLSLDNQEYNACPNMLVLDHYFDDARDPSDGDRVRTDLTFVTCSEDFLTQVPVSSTVQFLVYNEFEQRFSTSRKVTCVTEVPLSNIDTRPTPKDDYASIFNVEVQGTLTGQTVMRAVAGSETNIGHGILAVAEEFHLPEIVGEAKSAAYIPAQRGVRTQPDFIYLPLAGPSEP
jgi:hypothetical protein